MKSKFHCKAVIGIGIFSFGFGVLVSFFIPNAAIAVIEAAVLIALGALFFLQR